MKAVFQMTHDERVEMYMDMPKREVAEMLVNANTALEDLCPQLLFYWRGASYHPTVTKSAGA